MKVLVTGGAGFVGAAVCRALLDAGHSVTVLDDLSTGAAAVLPDAVTLTVGEVGDAATVDAALRHGFDAVVHLAAKLIVAESVRAPAAYHRVNVDGMRVLLTAMRRHGCCRLVFSSTAAVYATTDAPESLQEDAPLAPASPYGETKLLAEWLIGEQAEDWLGAVVLRFFNVAGALAGIPESRLVETHLIPLVLDVADGTRPVIDVYGEDYPTDDGTAIRDYVHVEDVAAAHVASLASVTASGLSVFNIGTGVGHSVLEVLDVARRVTGHPIPARTADRRPGDPACLVASPASIEAALGWSARKPDLPTIIADAWNARRRR